MAFPVFNYAEIIYYNRLQWTESLILVQNIYLPTSGPKFHSRAIYGTLSHKFC